MPNLTKNIFVFLHIQIKAHTKKSAKSKERK